MSERRMYGTVVWFNDTRGFGFVRPEGASGDRASNLFFHSRSVMGSLRALRPSTPVSFIVIDGPRGQEAANVKVVRVEESNGQGEVEGSQWGSGVENETPSAGVTSDARRNGEVV